MDLKYLKRLMDIFDSSTATRLEIEEEGIKLKVSKVEKEGKSNVSMIPMPFSQPQAPVPAQAPVTPPASAETREEAPREKAKEPAGQVYHEIKSPIVGTFYRAPSPESEPFVEVGTKISKGTVLCIVEAMKLMNEIESDVTGTVEKILVENSSPVEYNQVMFLIKPE